ncbi:hypothetical protein ACFE04_027825 [Oxalis oulophora]
MVGGLLISRWLVETNLPSHRIALQRCIEHAGNWIMNEDKAIEPNVAVADVDVHICCQFPISNRSPPEDSAISEAEQCLKVLEALDGSGRLIPFGKAMAHFPPASMLLSLRNISYGTRKDVEQSWTISSAKEEEIICKSVQKDHTLSEQQALNHGGSWNMLCSFHYQVDQFNRQGELNAFFQRSEFPFINASQIEGVCHTDSGGPSNRLTTNEIQESSTLPRRHNDQRSENDDVLEIAELMAKNQFERCLPDGDSEK